MCIRVEGLEQMYEGWTAIEKPSMKGGGDGMTGHPQTLHYKSESNKTRLSSLQVSSDGQAFGQMETRRWEM